MNYYNEIKNEIINNNINKKIKDYSKNKSDLKRMRQFYNIIEKGAPLEHQLTWSHYNC